MPCSYCKEMHPCCDSSCSSENTNSQLACPVQQACISSKWLRTILRALRRHPVQGKLRIVHCGDFHAALFHVLVKAVNMAATLLGRPIHWHTETVRERLC